MVKRAAPEGQVPEGDPLELRLFPPEHNRSLKGVLSKYVQRSLALEDWSSVREQAWEAGENRCLATPPSGLPVPQETDMRSNDFPPGLDEQGIRDLIEYYESQTDEEAAAEHEAALASPTGTLLEIR